MNKLLKYRPDLDGLRAIAVLAVLLYHEFPDWCRGGFVGVDIFFVLSGFLISTIVFRECDAGIYSARRFYARRVRRLFPSLLTIVAVTALAGWILLLPEEFSRLGRHIVASMGYVENLNLWNENVRGEEGYFNIEATQKPLLHLWSLSIEEQFYLSFPLLLWLIRMLRFPLLPLLTLICAGSFGLNLMLVHAYSVPTFYLPPTRLWELMAGVLLAALSLYRTKKTWLPHNRIMSWMGMALILGSIAFLHEDLNAASFFPGWWGAIPVLGAALMIAAGPQTWVNRHLLSNRAMTSIGLISYPLYLWHWPLFSFATILFQGHISPRIHAAIFAASFLLAWLTYLWVEKPLRFSTSRHVVPSLLAVSAGLLILGLLVATKIIAPYSSRFHAKEYEQVANDWYFPTTAERRVFPQGTFLALGGDERYTLYVGDSNMRPYLARITQIIADHPRSTRGAIFITNAGCPFIPHMEREGYDICDRSLQDLLHLANNPRIDRIVLAADWFSYFGPLGDIWHYQEDSTSLAVNQRSAGAIKAMDSLRALIRTLQNKGKQVYFVSNIPTGRSLDPRNLARRETLLSLIGEPVQRANAGVDRQAFVAQYQWTYDQLKSLGAMPGIIFIDPFTYLCTPDWCYAFDRDAHPIYINSDHLSASFVRKNIRYLDATIQ